MIGRGRCTQVCSKWCAQRAGWCSVQQLVGVSPPARLAHWPGWLHCVCELNLWGANSASVAQHVHKLFANSLNAAGGAVSCCHQIKTMSWLSGVSTASMGKFDKKLPGEKDGERKLPGKRRRFSGVTDAAADRALMSKTAEKLLRTKADDVLDINKAIGKFEAEARQARHVAKQAAGEGGSSKKGGKKGRQQQGGKDRGAKGGKGGKGGGQKGGKGTAGLKARGGVSKKGGKRGK